MIKIDKDIPIAAHPPKTKVSKYPWPDMEVGDSFFLPGIKTADFSGAAHSAGLRTGKKFSLRSVTEDGVEGARCWRVK